MGQIARSHTLRSLARLDAEGIAPTSGPLYDVNLGAIGPSASALALA